MTPHLDLDPPVLPTSGRVSLRTTLLGLALLPALLLGLAWAASLTWAATTNVSLTPQQTLMQGGVLLAVLLLGTLVAASRTATRLIRRIETLSQATARVSQGELDVPIPTQGEDELAVLAQSIDRLAESSRIALQTLDPPAH